MILPMPDLQGGPKSEATLFIYDFGTYGKSK